MQRRHFLIGLPALLAATRGFAHHGWSSFDDSRPLYLEGVVRKISWSNPHVELDLEVVPELKLPADLATRGVPSQSASVDAKGILSKTALPRRKDRQWHIELAPLSRMNQWKVAEIKPGESLSMVGYTFKDEQGEPVLRVEYLFRGGAAIPLRSAPV